ncbi:MAG: BrnT family toxin [Acetobacteraceae bacterium]
MEYEWDEAKRRANLAKHGVDFAAAEGFEWETATIQPDLRRDNGETRFRAFGLINDMLHLLVFTMRHGVCRIISFRPANRKEVIAYDPTRPDSDSGRG